MTPADTLLALAAKIRARVKVSGNGCWEWTGARNPSGYGQTWWNGRRWATHRAMVAADGRELPPGMQVDHLCRNPCCCNPAHLDVVTPRENTLRGAAGENRKKEAALITRCPKGHPYTPENTYTCPAGKRTCRACKRRRDQARRAARPLTRKSLIQRRYHAEKRASRNG